MHIYVLTNRVNGKMYVGKTSQEVQRRIKQHTRDAKNNRYTSLLHRAIRKYGIKSFHLECLKVSDRTADLWEKHLIKRWTPEYNIAVGGTGGITATAEERSIKQREVWKRKEYRKHMSEVHKGQKPLKTAFKKGHIPKNKKAIILTHPDGSKEIFDSVTSACVKYDLNQGHLSAVARGERRHHKLYKARHIDD